MTALASSLRSPGRRSWHDQARAMHEADPALMLREIAAECGVTPSAVWKALNPEAAARINRRANARRGAEKAAWAEAHRLRCSNCGRARAAGSARVDGSSRCAGELCADCRRERRVSLVLRMVALRCEEDLSNREIAKRLDTPVNTVAVEMNRMRSLGFDVPLAQYARARGASQATEVPGRDALGLGRSLEAQGITVPYFALNGASPNGRSPS